MSLETHKSHQAGQTVPNADAYKEVAAPYSPETITEDNLNDECTLQVSDKECTLEFSDRDYNLDLHQYTDNEHTDKQAEAGLGIEDQEDGNGRQSTADGKQDPELESVTGTVKSHKSRRREWIILGSALGAVVLLVVIIVPSVIFGIRHSRPQHKPPPNPYTP
ncbi:hypothetical protein N7457_000968 [Penicillium paradoxum]|uniref:uncharacterized protein n=1 Tax=Penicillium paradoxum TaxID=176176 RepID=UPI00254813C1|nr:uncharacterized protein N7457_000968 [Penicillium paradoxum]KAJ5794369.1 hypothetical protein N7457_000968 [Penicillium paradoxum]